MSDYPSSPTVGVPPSVSKAITTIWVLVGLAVINTVLSIVMIDTLIESWANSSPGWQEMYENGGREAVEGSAPQFIPIGIIGLVIFGVVYIGLALMLRKGKGWARIVLTILAVLNVLSALSGFAQARPAVFMVLQVITAIVAVALLVFLWNRQTTDFIRASKSRGDVAV